MYNKNDIITIKLISGEEIVTRFLEENDTAYRVYKPLSVMPSAQGLSLIQTVISVGPEQEMNVNKACICLHAPSRKEMADAWIESATGIKPAASKILKG